MTVAFTGTRAGMAEPQIEVVLDLVHSYKYVQQWHHGDCDGADGQFHDIVFSVYGNADRIHIQPSTIEKKRVHKHSPNIYPPKPPLIRNHNMVDVTRGLIATPRLDFEILRSGTWATVRYARKLHRPIFIVWPNGTMKVENPTAIGRI